MAAQPFSISWNNFSGGLSDNIRQIQPGRYWTGYNVDTRRYDVSPSASNIKLYNLSSESEPINCMFNNEVITGQDNIISWINDGKIYYNNILSHSLSVGKQGYRIGYLKPTGSSDFYLYYFQNIPPSASNINIHRSSVTASGMSEGYRTYVSNTGNSSLTPPNGMQVISEGSRILFSHYNTLFELNIGEVVNTLLTFTSNENIIGITKFQGRYKIYTTIGYLESKVYLWDGISDATELLFTMPGIPLSSVINDGANDYATSIDGTMYQIAGVQYIDIYTEKGLKVLANYNGYILGNYFDENNISHCMFTYGSKPGYSKSITPQYAYDSSNNDIYVTQPSNIVFSSNYLYYAVGGDIYRISATARASISYIESAIFIGSNIQYEKEIEYLIFKFSNTSSDCSIKLEAQIQENGTWITLYNGKNSDISTVNSGLKLYKNMFANPIGNFTHIRFKVSFTSNGTSLCKFYGLDLVGNENIGK